MPRLLATARYDLLGSMERGAEVFAGDRAKEDYERRIAELEQLLGKKEVEIALLKNFLRRTP